MVVPSSKEVDLPWVKSWCDMYKGKGKGKGKNEGWRKANMAKASMTLPMPSCAPRARWTNLQLLWWI